MIDKNTTNDEVRVSVLKVLGEDVLRILTQLINNTYDTGECPKDFTGS
jgi:hypothetical protein